MRHHAHGFAMKHRDKLEVILSNLLAQRSVDYDGYLDKMFNIQTCGFETTLIIVSIMLGIDICVLSPDFVWLSEDVPPYKCPVVLVQDISGRFYRTKVTNPVYIGLVPEINCPMTPDNNLDMVEHSTPR